MMKLRTRRALALAGAAVVVSMTLTGCSAITSILSGGSGDADRNKDGEVQEESQIGIFSLKVGDCKMEDSAESLTETKVVPCDESHDEEVYYEFDLEDGDFPGDEAVLAATQDGCLAPFEEFVGISYDASTLDYFGIRPTEETWTQSNDRVVQCVVWDPAGPVTGSLKGIAR